MRPHSTDLSRVCAHCETTYAPESGYGTFCSRRCCTGHRYAPAAERFWKYVDTSGECWLWTGALIPDGYGQFLAPSGKVMGAHRFSWAMANGPIPAGIDVCHRCDVRYPAESREYRRCVRPDHLWLGTRADNNRDREAKGRGKQPGAKGDRNGAYTHPERLPRGEQNGGHRLTAEQVVAIRASLAEGATHRGIARRYRVNKWTVGKIAHGETWAHLL